MGDDLLLGRGEESSGGRAKASILADAIEAIIGAVYLDGGCDAAERLVLRELARSRSPRPCREPDDFDHKSRLQERAVRDGRGHSPLRGRRLRARIMTGATWPRCSWPASAVGRGRGGPRRTPSRTPLGDCLGERRQNA